MMDITNTIKQYQQRIEKLKPHFVMMILDTYIKFDDFEKENERVDKFIQTQKESIEDYEKGREYEKKWVGLIDKYNESKVTQSIQNE